MIVSTKYVQLFCINLFDIEINNPGVFLFCKIYGPDDNDGRIHRITIETTETKIWKKSKNHFGKELDFLTFQNSHFWLAPVFCLVLGSRAIWFSKYIQQSCFVPLSTPKFAISSVSVPGQWRPPLGSAPSPSPWTPGHNGAPHIGCWRTEHKRINLNQRQYHAWSTRSRGWARSCYFTGIIDSWCLIAIN